MINVNEILKQMNECKKVICSKLIPFKEQGEFFIRWEGSFIDENTGLPMQLIIPKLSMNLLKMDTVSDNYNKISIANFQVKNVQENKQDILFTIKVDKEEIKNELYG